MRPVEFSPGSRFLAINVEDGDPEECGLYILDEDLATISMTCAEYRCRDRLHFAWTPSCCCVIIDCPPSARWAEQSPHTVEAVWQAAQPHNGKEDEAKHVNTLLEAFGPGEVLQHFSCSPVAGYAAVTQKPGAGQPSEFKYVYTLYVLQPADAAASIVVAEKRADIFLTSGHVVWSPTGKHLLISSDEAIELVSSTCELVKAYSCPSSTRSESRGAAVFAPCGRHAALFCGSSTLQVCRVRDGIILLSMAGKLCYGSRLSFSPQGDQLRLFGGKCIIISFGQDQAGRSQKACHAVQSACSSELGKYWYY